MARLTITALIARARAQMKSVPPQVWRAEELHAYASKLLHKRLPEVYRRYPEWRRDAHLLADGLAAMVGLHALGMHLRDKAE